MNDNPNPKSSASQSIQALTQFGCFRLASRVHDLRQRGIDICKRMVKNPNNGKRYAEYYINPEQS